MRYTESNERALKFSRWDQKWTYNFLEQARRKECREFFVSALRAQGLGRVGRYLGIGIANLITIISPDRVVIGGGIAVAGDLLLEPIRAELRLRVRTTALDDVTLVTAELGTWAGSMGAAVHGAEAAATAGALDHDQPGARR